MRVLSPVMLPVVVLMGLAAAPAPAQADSIYGTPRQYYSDYTYVPSCGYGYRTYYFKPTPDYAGYDYNYVIYPQYDQNNAYYYNPHTQSYWGRCPSHCHGEPLYSLLRPIHRGPSLAEIPAAAFPKPGPLPVVPGATDGTRLDLAPDNTPVIGAPGPGAAGPPPGAGGPPPGAGGPPPGVPPGVPTAAGPPPDAPLAAAAAPPPAQ
ncbi:MAG: hypothetical protein AB7U20_20535 [Planctomycetaceae bacterium]